MFFETRATGTVLLLNLGDNSFEFTVLTTDSLIFLSELIISVFKSIYKLSLAINHFQVGLLSLSTKQNLVHNYSYETELNLHVDKILCSYEKWAPG